MAMMALGMGLILTALAVAIGGIVIEAVLLLIHRSLKAAEPDYPQSAHAAIQRSESEDDLTSALDWAEHIAA